MAPLPTPRSSPLPLTWELLGLLLHLRRRLGLLRTSDNAVTSYRKPWWADFSFFCFYWQDQQLPFSHC